jgi:uncharacterized protein (DUF1800 family)
MRFHETIMGEAMSSKDIALMAHLMRRAGFGASRDELDAYVAKGYEATVEELLHPSDPGNLPDDVIRRFYGRLDEWIEAATVNWLYRMVTTRCPLEEKLTLFWHGLFATAWSKGINARSLLTQVETSRRLAFGSFRDLLVALSKSPSMLYFLDNVQSHKGAINENYARELLELFSMGVGNYTEQDIKECARAFTGWTIGNAEYAEMIIQNDIARPYGRTAWHFVYRADDHDDGEKTFFGETGRFNGEDIIDIIVRQPATPRFICRRLFQFFAADEVDEEGERVIEAMIDSYFDSGYEIRSVLRTLFKSAYFKSEKALFARVKGPVELLVGAYRLNGSHRELTAEIRQTQTGTPMDILEDVAFQTKFLGQYLLEPPGVEGWHEGEEWIDSGVLVERVNFLAKEFGDISKLGVRAIIDRLATEYGGILSPDEVVDRCLELMGYVTLSESSRAAIAEHVAIRGELDLRGHRRGDESERRVGEVLSLIASTPDYQLA